MKIGIVGYGVVGKAIEYGFKDNAEILISDPAYKDISVSMEEMANDCEFIFVAVERDFPFGVGVYQLSHRDMSNGIQMYSDLTSRLAECERTDNWPGYTTGIETLDAYTR